MSEHPLRSPRRVSPEKAWQVAHVTLGRMACEHMDPAAHDHDHAECVHDDTSYAADLLLRLCAAVIGGDDDATLERLEDVRKALSLEE